MSLWDGPRRARPEEFAEAMRFTDRVFRPGQSGRRIVQSQYPHVYRDEAAYARRLLLLRHEGELVGCVAIHPMTLRLGAARLQVGGIGIVGTHPERRGEGIMTTLLQDAIERMRHAGCAVSVLGGDRQRYARFGWEHAGVRIVHQLTERSLGPPSAADRKQPMQRLQAGDRGLLARIRRLSDTRAFGVARAAGDMAPLLCRKSKQTWTCTAGRRFAYVVVGGANRRARPYAAIDEFGGDPELTLVLFRRLLARAPDRRLSVISGPNGDEQALLVPVSASWSRLSDGMAQILDTGRVIEQLQPELRRRAAELGLSGTFSLYTTDQALPPADLLLPRAKGSSHDGVRRQHLRLNRLELVELLLGSVPLQERFAGHDGISARALSTLAPLLPLPLHIPSLNHI